MKVLNGIKNFFVSLFQFVFYFRRFFLAIPVVYVAVKEAKKGMEQLPELVGLVLEKNGTYSLLVPREQAVFLPLIITGGCLLCMFFSRKVFYPWLISVVTLVIPVLILLLNQLF